MNNRLRGKFGVVTGGASGIGAATARIFATEGAAIVIADRQAPADPASVELLSSKPERVWFVECDVERESQVVAAIATAQSRW